MPEQNKCSHNRIQFILAVIALLAPIFYLIGLSFNQGQLATYGVDSDSFPLTVQDTYVSAYLAIAHLLIALSTLIKNTVIALFTPPQLYWLGGLFFIVLSGFYLLFKRWSICNYSLIKKVALKIKRIFAYLHWDNNHMTAAFGITGIIAYLLFSMIYILATLFLFWLFPIIFGYNPGKDIANKNIDSFEKEGCHFEEGKRWSNCRMLKSRDGRTLYEGILIANSDNRVAFFTKKGAIVAAIPDGAVIVNQANKHE